MANNQQSAGNSNGLGNNSSSKKGVLSWFRNGTKKPRIRKQRASHKGKFNRVLILSSIVIFTFLVAFIVSNTVPFRTLELKVIDQLFELRGPLSLEDTPIVLVKISDQADQEIPYKWPWPTEIYARLIKNLNKAGAKAIGLDVLFSNPDRYDLANDTTFAKALKKYGNVVMAGKIVKEDNRVSDFGILQTQTAKSSQISVIDPIEVLSEANPNPFGLVNVERDLDGFLRRYNFAQKFLGEKHYAFGLEVLRVYLGLDSVQVKNTGDTFHYGPFEIPKFNHRSMMINYYGGPGSFPSYHFEQVIDDSTFTTVMEEEAFELNAFDDPEFGLLHQDVFRDKLVLVGSTMLELHDFFPTPFSHAESGNENQMMPGFETHANAIQTILDGNYIHHSQFLTDLLIIFLLGLLTSVVTYATRSVWGFLNMFVLFVGYFSLVIYLFVSHSYLLTMIGPLLAVLTGYVTTTSYDLITQQREKKRIKNMFASYVSPELVEQMVESEEEPQLGGDEVYITAFFSDIQSFSAFSEVLEPKKLVMLINEYLSAMTDIITDQGGTLDKYIGDAIVAFFFFFFPLPDHAYRACISSQLMQHKLGELRQKWRAEGDKWPEIVWNMRNRIGANTGWMVTGNMGSTSRFNYTMMGDNVNLAARCESGAKAYGAYTMITEDTKQEAEKYGDACVFRFLDRIVVVGRTQPVDVYELVDLKEYMTPQTFECIETYEEGIEAYLNQEWTRAISLFQQSAQIEPNQIDKKVGVKTNPSQIMIKRCREMSENPPAPDWNGVYVMESK